MPRLVLSICVLIETQNISGSQRKGALKTNCPVGRSLQETQRWKTAQNHVWTNIWEHFSISNPISQVFSQAGSLPGPWGEPVLYWGRLALGAAGWCLLQSVRIGEALSVQMEWRIITSELRKGLSTSVFGLCWAILHHQFSIPGKGKIPRSCIKTIKVTEIFNSNQPVLFEAFKEIVDFACSYNLANLSRVFFWVNVLRTPASSSRHSVILQWQKKSIHEKQRYWEKHSSRV